MADDGHRAREGHVDLDARYIWAIEQQQEAAAEEEQQEEEPQQARQRVVVASGRSRSRARFATDVRHQIAHTLSDIKVDTEETEFQIAQKHKRANGLLASKLATKLAVKQRQEKITSSVVAVKCGRRLKHVSPSKEVSWAARHGPIKEEEEREREREHEHGHGHEQDGHGGRNTGGGNTHKWRGAYHKSQHISQQSYRGSHRTSQRISRRSSRRTSQRTSHADKQTTPNKIEHGLSHVGPGAIAIERRGARIVFALTHWGSGKLHVVGGTPYEEDSWEADERDVSHSIMEIRKELARLEKRRKTHDWTSTTRLKKHDEVENVRLNKYDDKLSLTQSELVSQLSTIKLDIDDIANSINELDEGQVGSDGEHAQEQEKRKAFVKESREAVESLKFSAKLILGGRNRVRTVYMGKTDTTGDGVPNAGAYDSTGNGVADSLDTNGDGKIDIKKVTDLEYGLKQQRRKERRQKEPKTLCVLEAAGHVIACFGTHWRFDLAYTGGIDGSVICWNFKSVVQLWRIRPHRERITSMAVMGDMIVTGAQDACICALNYVKLKTDDRHRVWTFDWHETNNKPEVANNEPEVTNGPEVSDSEQERVAALGSYRHGSGRKLKHIGGKLKKTEKKELEELIAHTHESRQRDLKANVDAVDAVRRFQYKTGHQADGKFNRTVVGTIDTTGDGRANATAYDTTGDGMPDSLDTQGDGKIDTDLRMYSFGATHPPQCLHVGGCVGQLENEHKLANVFMNAGYGVLAVTMCPRFKMAIEGQKVSYAIVTVSAREAGHTVVLDKSLGLNIAPIDLEVLERSQNQSVSHTLRQHIEQLRMRNVRVANNHKDSAPELAINCSTPILTLVFVGDALVCGSSDGTICCFDSGTGIKRWHTTEHVGGIQALCGSMNWVYSASNDSTVRAWDVRNGQEMWEEPFQEHQSGVMALQMSADRNTIFSGGWARKDKDWDVRQKESYPVLFAINAITGRKLWSSGHPCSIGDVARVSIEAQGQVPDVFGQTNRKARESMWSDKMPLLETYQSLLETGSVANSRGHLAGVAVSFVQQAWDRSKHLEGILSIAVTKSLTGAEIVCAGTSDKVVRGFEADTGEELWQFDDLQGGVTGLEACGGVIYSGSADKTSEKIVALEAEGGEQRWQLLRQDDVVTRMILGKDIVFSASDHGVITATEISTGQVKWHIPDSELHAQGHTKQITCFCISYELGYLFSGSKDKTIRATHIGDDCTSRGPGRGRWEFTNHEDEVLAMCCFEDKLSQRLFSGSADGTVRCIDADTGSELWRFHADTLNFLSAAMHADTTTTAGRKIRENPVTHLVMENDAHALYSAHGGVDKSVRKLSTENGEELWHFTTARVTAMQATDDGKTLIVASDDQTFHCLDGKTGNPIWMQTESTGSVVCLAVFGTILYTCSELRQNGRATAMLRSFNLEDGEFKVKFTFHDQAPVSIQLVKDQGNWLHSAKHILVVGCDDGNLYTLSEQLEQLVVISGQHTDSVDNLAANEESLFSASTGKVIMTQLKPLCRYREIRSGPLVLLSAEGLGSISKLKAFDMPRFDFLARAMIILYTWLQLLTFAFSRYILNDHDDFHTKKEWLREVPVNGRLTLFYAILTLTFAIVVLFFVVFGMQEYIEWQDFIYPEEGDKSWKQLWVGLSFFAQLCTTILFIPICTSFARAIDCTFDPETKKSYLDASMPANRTGRNTGEIICFPNGLGVHWILVGTTVPFALLFCLLSARLIRAGGELRNMEMTGRRLWNCDGDSQKRLPFRHTLSPRSAMHEMATITIKCAVVLVSTFFGSQHPISVVSFMVVATFTLLIVTLKYPPFYGPGGSADSVAVLTSKPNRMRCLLDFVLFYCYVCAFTATLAQSQHAEQFGVSGVDPSALMISFFPATVPFVAGIGYFLVPTFAFGSKSLAAKRAMYQKKSTTQRVRACFNTACTSPGTEVTS